MKNDTDSGVGLKTSTAGGGYRPKTIVENYRRRALRHAFVTGRVVLGAGETRDAINTTAAVAPAGRANETHFYNDNNETRSAADSVAPRSVPGGRHA